MHASTQELTKADELDEFRSIDSDYEVKNNSGSTTTNNEITESNPGNIPISSELMESNATDTTINNEETENNYNQRTVISSQPISTSIRIMEPPPYSYYQPVNYPNYRSLACFVYCCCAWLCGLIALTYSSQVDKFNIARNAAAAKDASQSAKRWSLIGIISGGVTFIVLIILVSANPEFLKNLKRRYYH